MADVSILPFRILCRNYGASLAYTEQINAIALSRESIKTLRMAETNEDDRPLALQLSGNNTRHIIDAAEKARGYQILDINMGCPSKKIISLGYGSALLNEKEKLKELITKIVSAIDVPVTVKMRSGFKKNEAPEIAKALEAAGVSAITIHARTQEQKYAGAADWETIRKVKEILNIPVIGNGDVTTPERAEEMLEKTGCDYVMIGRAAIKNPFIFRQCVEYEKKRTYSEPDKNKILEEYVSLCKKYNYGQSNNNLKMIAVNLIRGIDNSAKVRDAITKAKSDEEALSLFNIFINNQK